MASVLTINGATVNRVNSHLLLNELTLNFDEPSELSFTELNANLPGNFMLEQLIELAVDGELVFSGAVFSRHPDGYGVGPGRVGYRCLDSTYLASLLPVVATDGSGLIQFNLPVSDPNYVATQAGKTVGEIIQEVLDLHSGALAAINLTQGPNLAAQLANLNVVPPDPVIITGNTLWVQLLGLIQEWYGGRIVLTGYAGVIAVFDTFQLGSPLGLSAYTVTLDIDPAILTNICEETALCYSRVVLRGRADVEPAMLSEHDGTLVASWTPTDQSTWTWYAYAYPQGGYDQGDITALTSSTVTIRSDYAAAHWPANFWAPIQGQIAVINPAATGLTFQEFRHITANTSLAATVGGGTHHTSVLTLDRPLANSGYTRYHILGVPGGLSYVWRRFNISPTYVAQHLVQQFNYSVPFSTSMNAVSMVTSPVGVVCFGAGGGGAGIAEQIPFQFEVVPYDGVTDGYILAYSPIVQITSTQAQMNTGGAAVVNPTDVIVMVPYSRGTLNVQSPPDIVSGGVSTPQYSGTAYTEFGNTRTLYRDYPTWINAANNPAMQLLADNILQTVSSVLVEGSLVYLDKLDDAIQGSLSWPMALNIACTPLTGSGTTGYENINAPVRSTTLSWPQDGAAVWVTTLSFSSRRQQYSGDRLYVHPMFLSGGIMDNVGKLEFTQEAIQQTQLGGLQAQARGQAAQQYGGVVGQGGEIESFGKGAPQVADREGKMHDMTVGDLDQRTESGFDRAGGRGEKAQQEQLKQDKRDQEHTQKLAQEQQAKAQADQIKQAREEYAANPVNQANQLTQQMLGVDQSPAAARGPSAGAAQQAAEGGITARGPSAAQMAGPTAGEAQQAYEGSAALYAGAGTPKVNTPGSNSQRGQDLESARGNLNAPDPQSESKHIAARDSADHDRETSAMRRAASGIDERPAHSTKPTLDANQVEPE